MRPFEDQPYPMELEIAVNARSVSGKQNRRLRSTGVVPGVLFGKTTGSISVQVDAKALDAIYREAGRTGIVKVAIDGGNPTSAIIKSLQRHPLTGKALHVDLFALDLTHEMVADIPLLFSGVAPVIEQEGAILLTAMDHLKVRALPADLPSSFTVDLSPLVDMDSTIHVRDVAADGKVAILNEPDELVAKVTPPREEEVEEVVVAEGEEAAEGEEGAEGEAAVEGAGEAESEASEDEGS
jgi:large subunit ribosomal protein L25